MNKKYYIVPIIIAVFYIGIIFFYKTGDGKVKKTAQYMIMDTNTIVKYDGIKYTGISRNDTSYSMKKYKIFERDQGYITTAALQFYDSKWWAYDDNRKPINIPQYRIFAITENQEVDFKKFQVQKAEHDPIVEKVLKNNKLSMTDATAVKVVMDFNHDQKEESVYIVANLSDNLEKKSYSIVFYVDGNSRINYIDKQVNKSLENINIYRINYIVDLNLDKKYELILDVGKYGSSYSCSQIYQLDGKRFKNKYKCIDGEESQ